MYVLDFLREGCDTANWANRRGEGQRRMLALTWLEPQEAFYTDINLRMWLSNGTASVLPNLESSVELTTVSESCKQKQRKGEVRRVW